MVALSEMVAVYLPAGWHFEVDDTVGDDDWKPKPEPEPEPEPEPSSPMLGEIELSLWVVSSQ
jgi:hypothetical protein